MNVCTSCGSSVEINQAYCPNCGNAVIRQQKTSQLMKSADNKMISGVCAGIAEHLNVDPTLIRLLFVFGSIFYGGGLLVYLILAIVMPDPMSVNRG